MPNVTPRCQFIARCTAPADAGLVWTGPSARALWACSTCLSAHVASGRPSRPARMRDLRAAELAGLAGTPLAEAAADETRRRAVAPMTFRRIAERPHARIVAAPVRVAHVSRYRVSGRPADLRARILA